MVQYVIIVVTIMMFENVDTLGLVLTYRQKWNGVS